MALLRYAVTKADSSLHPHLIAFCLPGCPTMPVRWLCLNGQPIGAFGPHSSDKMLVLRRFMSLMQLMTPFKSFPMTLPSSTWHCGKICLFLQAHKAEQEDAEERDEEERDKLRSKKLGKDPTARTDFLPDKEREAEEEAVRAQLKKEYELRQKV